MEETKKENLRKFLKDLAIPIILLLVYTLLFEFQNVFHTPPENSILNLVINFIGSQSLILIFFIAIVEGIVFLGQYTPGWMIIFLSLISSEKDISQVSFFVALISVAFIIAYTFDYFIGYFFLNKVAERFGFHKVIDKYQHLIKGNLLKAVFFSYWETSLASVTASAAGFLKMPFRNFMIYTVGCVIFWNVFWAALFLTFGNFLIDFVKDRFLLIIILVWILFVIYKHYLKKEKTSIANL